MNPVVLVWLACSVFGLTFWIINLHIALQDRKAARLITNFRREARLIVIEGAVFRDRIRVGVFTWWTLLGIVFGFFKVPQVIGLAGTLGLVVTVLGLGITGLHELRERRRLDAILDRERREARK